MSLTAEQDAIEIAVSIRTALIYGHQIDSTEGIESIKALAKTHNLDDPDAANMVADALAILLSRDHLPKIDSDILVSQIRQQFLAAL